MEGPGPARTPTPNRTTLGGCGSRGTQGRRHDKPGEDATASGVAKPILVLPQEKVVWRSAPTPASSRLLPTWRPLGRSASWAPAATPSTGSRAVPCPGRYSVDRLTGRSLPRPLLRRPAHGPFPAPAARPARNGGRRRVARGVPVHGPAVEARAAGVAGARPAPGTTKLPGRGRRPPPVPSQEELWALVISGGRAGPPPGPLRAPAACRQGCRAGKAGPGALSPQCDHETYQHQRRAGRPRRTEVALC